MTVEDPKDYVTAYETPKKYPKLIGLMGDIGAGKDTVAALLSMVGYQPEAFATALKTSVMQTLHPLGVEQRHLFGTQSDKRQKHEKLGGATARQFCELVGSDGYRATYPDIWIDLLFLHIDNVWEKDIDAKFVITDVRFANEIKAVRSRGGEVWQVHKVGEACERTHHLSDEEWRSHDPDKHVAAAAGDMLRLSASVREALNLR